MNNPPCSDSVVPSAAPVGGGGQSLPELLIDSREKKPLTFEHLPVRVCTLRTGDYSIAGLDSRFTVERKSVSDLVTTLSQRRGLFMSELERMLSHEFRRLLVIGTWDELREVLSRRRITLASVLGSLASIDARGVPVVWVESPDMAAVRIESWAWYYHAGLTRAITGKHITAPAWARDVLQGIKTA